MITCPNCGNINANDAVTCEECMFLLNDNKQTGKESDIQNFSEKFSLSISGLDKNLYSSAKEADIMFVFDCTGSMMSEITAMKDAIIDFANLLITDGLNIRLGLIEFRDRLVNQEHKLHFFSGEVFTHNASLFMETISKLKANGGGGNGGESSLDAIMLALEQSFRNNQNKTIVLITDDAPHIPDKSTGDLQAVINRMKLKSINQFYIVTTLRKTKCHKHLELLEGVLKYGGDGLAFELSQNDKDRKEHFKKVLRGLAKSISSKSISI
jgi:hypothetical protein